MNDIELRTILKADEQLIVVTPHGEIKINVSSMNRSTSVWVWDNAQWKGFPQPEILEIRGDNVLCFILANPPTKVI